jgi:hypothetical protein
MLAARLAVRAVTRQGRAIPLLWLTVGDELTEQRSDFMNACLVRPKAVVPADCAVTGGSVRFSMCEAVAESLAGGAAATRSPQTLGASMARAHNLTGAEHGARLGKEE